MRLLDWLPWRRRVEQYERDVHAARERLRKTHDDWIPLGRTLADIDRQMEINDWTAAAKRLFSGRGTE